jgi:hypothetical protein
MANTMTQAQEDGYVECGDCGHEIEQHDTGGCAALGAECTCLEGWTKEEIRRVRLREGLPADWNV